MSAAANGSAPHRSSDRAKESQFPAEAISPITDALVPETMQAYFKRLKQNVHSTWFRVVDTIEEDGLYIGKRAIRGAQGQGDLLNQAGTVFYHTVLYIKKAGQTVALDYGPQGSADVTANVMEAVACASVLHKNAGPDVGHPLLRINHPHLDVESELCEKAIRFAERKKYHAIKNNCIQNTDFLCRVLTQGEVRNAPLIYDLLAGKVPPQDHPMLLMFFLMTQLSWFHVCDGSNLAKEFLEAEGLLSPGANAETQKKPKPSAQSRLEEQQLDLLSLVQSLQPKVDPSDLEPKPS